MGVQHMEAFEVSPYSVGIDLNRSQIKVALGNYVVDPTTTVRAGMLVQQATDQRIAVCTGANPFGFAKYNRASTLYGSVVGEYIQLNGTTATQLAHTDLLNPTGKTIRVALALTGGVYTEGAGNDYTVQHAAGTVTRLAGGTIADGAYVYVNYQYALSNDELNIHGRNFWNVNDDTAFQINKLTVITDWSLIFTTGYDSSHTYTVGQQLYCGRSTKTKSGLVCGDTTEGQAYIGRCFQLPTPTDPYLGIKYVGGMVS